MMLAKHIAALSLLLFSQMAISHDRYLLPSHTMLSGTEAESVSLISSISNDPFHPDMPLGDNGNGQAPKQMTALFNILQSVVIGPDGKEVTGPEWMAFARSSSASYELDQPGTYRFILSQPQTPMTTFKTADGKPGRIFGPKPAIPEGASDIVRRVITSQTETFISKQNINNASFTPRGKYLELSGETHPNDLFADEDVNFSLTLNGKAVPAGTKVMITEGGTRYRNQRNEIQTATNNRGEFSFRFPKAGMYLLKATLDVPGDNKSHIDMYHHYLFVTLEVFPQ
ncbi:DUF4198 domain-containing protein [Bacterioplanoides sp. SCSIO 12839]|uniref:DUF4198 domain-containing protein n=1 Tax=Bacterioplanoides sp. SCSIO 12839 TaxID=2829569 RepID=UPI002105B78E|nr:DUF4198 domain-containing protein [Bacterioplanoides sp. SCSIO 12839]UTW49336.1 DUF4198 domain-containing protein [Bacterioplanoides sp. SCSIO 12839]